jgi:molybdopterin-binding protein
MSEYSVGQVADLVGVSSDTVRRLCDEGTLETTRSAGGHRVIPGPALARYLSGTEVAWEPEAVLAQSARNRFTGIVTRVEKDSVTALVELRAGPHRIVSLMTAEAVEELELAPGELAVAAVKSTNVVIEVPPGTGRRAG